MQRPIYLQFNRLTTLWPPSTVHPTPPTLIYFSKGQTPILVSSTVSSYPSSNYVFIQCLSHRRFNVEFNQLNLYYYSTRPVYLGVD